MQCAERLYRIHVTWNELTLNKHRYSFQSSQLIKLLKFILYSDVWQFITRSKEGEENEAVLLNA